MTSLRQRLGAWARSYKAWTVVGVALALVVARALLPLWVERYVDRQLDELEGYDGQVADVDLCLVCGAYSVEGLRIVKTDGKVPVPFVSIPRMRISVEWKALLDGAIVAEIELDRPKLNFVADGQTSAGGGWQDTVRGLVPIKINRFAVRDGEVHYRDFRRKPHVNIYLQNVRLTVTNLTNSSDLSKSMFARIHCEALAMNSGRMKVDGALDPFADAPTFDLNFALRGLDITELNDFLRAYVKVDAQRGRFSLFSELASDEGRVDGYVKPIIRDLDILDWGEEQEGFFKKLWEGLVGAVAELFENRPEDQLATRIPIHGSFSSPDVDVWSAIGATLRNAFVQALARGLEGSVQLSREQRRILRGG